MKSIFELKKDDFQKGKIALKKKRGLYYRDNNSGYTEHILDAGFYDAEEVYKYCFDENGKNGKWDVFGIPLEMALEQTYVDYKKIRAYEFKLDWIKKTINENVNYETIIF